MLSYKQEGEYREKDQQVRPAGGRDNNPRLAGRSSGPVSRILDTGQGGETSVSPFFIFPKISTERLPTVLSFIFIIHNLFSAYSQDRVSMCAFRIIQIVKTSPLLATLSSRVSA
jgi:hypothetical protein